MHISFMETELGSIKTHVSAVTAAVPKYLNLTEKKARSREQIR